MSHLTRRGLLGLTALTMTGLIAGCAEETSPLPLDKGPQLASPTPVLREETMTSILEEFAAALEQADKERSSKPLAPRISGSAKDFREATYDIISKVKEHESALQRPSANLVVPIVSTAEGFPRYALALVKDSKKDGLPFFVGFEQKDARSQYTSWGWARQAAGIEMPSVAGIETGTTQVTPEEEGFVLTPKDALAKYAEILSFGHDRMDPDDHVAEDPFQQSVHKEIQGERKQMNEGVSYGEVASVAEKYTVKEDDFLAMRTAEGGAVVMGTLLSTRRITIKSGSISYTDDNLFTTLAGTKEFKKELVREYGTTVLLHIPAKDSGAKVQPIGAFKVITKVSGR